MNKALPARAELQPTIAELKATPARSRDRAAANVLVRATEFSVEDLETALSNALTSQSE